MPDIQIPLVIENTVNNKARTEEIFDSLDVSEATRADYKYRIGLFLNFVSQNGINYNSYLEFKRNLAQRTDFSVATKNKYLATAKIFLRELNRQGLLPVDITQNIKTFNQSKKHKRDGLTHKEIENLVEKLKQLDNSPRNTRIKALFSLLAFQGLRQIEIIRLDVKDLDLVNATAFIQGKGQDDKELIHLHRETIKTLKIYLKMNKIADGALFKSLGNRKSYRITTMTVKRDLQAVLKPLGIEKTTHGFRHFYITTLLKKFDVRDVRKFSRHKNLEMLIVYDDETDIKYKTAEVFECFNDLKVIA